VEFEWKRLTGPGPLCHPPPLPLLVCDHFSPSSRSLCKTKCSLVLGRTESNEPAHLTVQARHLTVYSKACVLFLSGPSTRQRRVTSVLIQYTPNRTLIACIVRCLRCKMPVVRCLRCKKPVVRCLASVFIQYTPNRTLIACVVRLISCVVRLIPCVVR